MLTQILLVPVVEEIQHAGTMKTPGPTKIMGHGL